jgi:hypothetical protein
MTSSLEQKIGEIQRQIDALKKPQGWRDLPVLTVCEELLDLIRQLDQRLSQPTNLLTAREERRQTPTKEASHGRD